MDNVQEGGAAQPTNSLPISNFATIKNVESPKDGRIVQFFVNEGEKVRAGAILCKLDSDNEDRFIDNLEAAIKIVAIEKASLEDKVQLESRRQILTEAQTLSEIIRRAAIANQDDIRVRYSGGVLGPSDARLAELNIMKANLELVRANFAIQRFEFNLSLSKQRLDVLESQLPKELAFAKALKNNLNVVAPASGKVTFFVGQGGFIQRGHILASITVS